MSFKNSENSIGERFSPWRRPLLQAKGLDITPNVTKHTGLNAIVYVFKTALGRGYILILLSIEYILASLIEMCQGQLRMRNVKYSSLKNTCLHKTRLLT